MNRADRRAKGERRVVVGTQELASGKVLPVTEWQAVTRTRTYLRGSKSQVVKPAHVSKPKRMTREEIIEHMKAAGKLQIITA